VAAFACYAVHPAVAFAGSIRARATESITAATGKKSKNVANQVEAANARVRWVARQRALDLAIDQLGIDVDSARRKQLLANHEAWTSSYRVASADRSESEISVEVEVEIDLPKLRASLLPRTESVDDTPVLGAQTLSPMCLELGLRPQLVDAAWAGAGGAGKEGAGIRYHIEVRCTLLGVVTQTQWLAARVEMGPVGAIPVEAVGFGRSAQQASESALARASSDLVANLVGGNGPIEIVIEEAWPALAIRHLQMALKASIAGVNRVSLERLLADGTARVFVHGAKDAPALLLLLGELSMPAATIEKAEVRSNNQVGLRLRMRQDASQILQSEPDAGQTSEPIE
jgi:hypothetical protein